MSLLKFELNISLVCVKSATAAVSSSVAVISLVCTNVLMSCATAVARVLLILFHLVFCCLLVGLSFWTLVCASYWPYGSFVHVGYNRSLLAGAMMFHRNLNSIYRVIHSEKTPN